MLIAILRLSTNPVLRGVSFVYTWFFRGIPRLVLLAMIGSGVGFLYNRLDFGRALRAAVRRRSSGCRRTSRSSRSTSTQFSSTLLAGIVGLGLSEAAYMAEIARAGILSVDKGQAEAAPRSA